jgi:hypothetical protein
MRKKCEKCGNEYNAKRKVQKYCTRECQYNSYKKKNFKFKLYNEIKKYGNEKN